MKSRTELQISIIQIGDSKSATTWLKGLGKALLDAGAKFNIVEVVTTDQYKGLTLEK